MVEDHSVGTEYPTADYTGVPEHTAVDRPGDKFAPDAEPQLNRYTPSPPEQPADTGQDLRPEPATDFRSELPMQPELPVAPPEPQLELPVAQPTTQPITQPADHLSPSLPIPEPPAVHGYRPYQYRSALERAATELPAAFTSAPPPIAPPIGTAYFGAAPSISAPRYEQKPRWTSGRPLAAPQAGNSWESSNEPPKPEPTQQAPVEQFPAQQPPTEQPPQQVSQQVPQQVPQPPAQQQPSNEQLPQPQVPQQPSNEQYAVAQPEQFAPQQPQAEQYPQQPQSPQAPAQQPVQHTPVQHTPVQQVPQPPAPQAAAPHPPQQPAPTPQSPAAPAPQQAAPATDLGEAWTRVLAGLPPNQRAWLTNSRPVTLHESTAIVAVPDDFTRGQLETRLRPDLERILSESFGRDIRIAVTVDPSLDPELQTPQPPPAPVVREPLRTEGSFQPTIQSALTDPMDQANQPQYAPPPQEPPAPTYEQPAPAYEQQQPPAQPFGQPPAPAPAAAQQATEAQGEARLNPKYTFETFVIGSSNRFAHAAAVAVAEAPGKAYNPQLIYGDSGLGKTHLLHAIGHYVRSLYTGARVRYVSSEEFTNDFINAIRDDKAAQFQRRYRDVDVLLIDDIQFLEGKIQTQEEFFHTFNTLHNANKQIVISSDRAPKRLEALEDRLRNRFEWGLITDIQPPDLETRIAILRKKAATERLTAPPEVLEFIASKVQTNIRELEGALIRVTAFASLNRQPVDLSLAEIVLKDLIPEGSKPEVTASMIMGQTASYFGLSIDDLCGSSRSRVLVTARQIAMYLCRELTDLSLPKIGQQFGGRDHTTVMHAERKIRQLMSERRSVFNQVTELTNRIKHQAKQQ